MYEVSLKYPRRLSNYILWWTDPRTDARGETKVQELWFLCMTRRLNVLYKSMKICWNTSNGYPVIEWTRNSIVNDQRKITPKISKAELWFLCKTRCLNLLYKCMRFRWITSHGYQVIERTRNSIANDQREIRPKISKAELWLLCMTRRLNVLYKHMKFRWNTWLLGWLMEDVIQHRQMSSCSYMWKCIRQ